MDSADGNPCYTPSSPQVAYNEQNSLRATERPDSSSAASPLMNESDYGGLTDIELAAARELRSEDVVKMLQTLKRKYDDLDVGALLQDIVPETVKKIKLAINSQYSTEVDADATDATAGLGQQDSSSSIPPQIFLDTDAVALLEASISAGPLSEDQITRFERLSRVTPLRLSYEERFFLRLLESTLEVSEYTDKVDIVTRFNPAKAMAHQIKQIFAILSGLAIAHHYEEGQRMIRERVFANNADFFRETFEFGRRYKILNPERMRNSYGKLVYFLMDSRRPDIAQVLGFDCVAPVKTVLSLLTNRKGGRELLKDPLILLATMDIDSTNKSRDQVQREIRQKDAAIKALVGRYATPSSSRRGGIFSRFTASIGLSSNPVASDNDGVATSNNGGVASQGTPALEGLTADEIQQALYSLCDHHTYLRFNRDPVDKMLKYLEEYFDPRDFSDGFSLAITQGRGGARLTHSHARQYLFVHQSLSLWREILQEMLGLWTLAEVDLLDSNNCYRLMDTGQGLNRVQSAPRVYAAMQKILARVRAQTGQWCGSSTVHLGDHNVPNALMFIDKYTQVPRILSPVVLCISKIPDLYKQSDAMKQFIDTAYGGPTRLTRRILADFFRHAFDGSGADNFYDAGSCIDGRLTSAWNWCSNIENKTYFPIFLLTGFVSFDGSF